MVKKTTEATLCTFWRTQTLIFDYQKWFTVNKHDLLFMAAKVLLIARIPFILFLIILWHFPFVWYFTLNSERNFLHKIELNRIFGTILILLRLNLKLKFVRCFKSIKCLRCFKFLPIYEAFDVWNAFNFVEIFTTFDVTRIHIIP